MVLPVSRNSRCSLLIMHSFCGKIERHGVVVCQILAGRSLCSSSLSSQEHRVWSISLGSLCRRTMQQPVFRRPNQRVPPRRSVDSLTFAAPNGPRPALQIPHVRPASAAGHGNPPRALSNIAENPIPYTEENVNARNTISTNGANTRRSSVKKDSAQGTQAHKPTLSLFPPVPREKPKVPDRRSSKSNLRDPASNSVRAASGRPTTVPSRGHASSPIRHVVQKQSPVSSEMHRVASHTMLLKVKPVDIPLHPNISHARIDLSLGTSASMYMGGSSVEGKVPVAIDQGKVFPWCDLSYPLFLGRITITLLGVESCNGKHCIFTSLVNELVGDANPPPAGMVCGPRSTSDAYWETVASFSNLPFRINLPLNMGPPPYKSKHVAIKYLVSVTVAIRIDGKHVLVRKSHEITILTVHDRKFKHTR
jgi:hypothetical protein